MALWALKDPKGKLWPETIAINKEGCWLKAFEMMPLEFCDKYWKRWDASIAAAKKDGYEMVRVAIKEINRG